MFSRPDVPSAGDPTPASGTAPVVSGPESVQYTTIPIDGAYPGVPARGASRDLSLSGRSRLAGHSAGTKESAQYVSLLTTSPPSRVINAFRTDGLIDFLM